MAETEHEPAHDHIEIATKIYGAYPVVLDAHLTKPFAIVARVSGEAVYADGEPKAGCGEALVRLVNGAAHSVPEAMDGCPPIYLSIGYPWTPIDQRAMIRSQGGIMLTADTARALGEALVNAADMVSGEA